MRNVKNKANSFFTKIKSLPIKASQLLSYIFLISLKVFLILTNAISKRVIICKRISLIIQKLINIIDHSPQGTISKSKIIDIAIKNMFFKKNRTLITIGGLAVGIATIVFLVSIGYGLETLVISRVARLDEMKQADVSILPGSNLILDDDSINSFNEIENVKMVLPQISLVGKVNFNNSLTDTAVYGVTKDYLEQSAIAPTIGKNFNSNQLTTDLIGEKETYSESKGDKDVLEPGWIEIEGESNSGESTSIAKVKFPNEIKDKEAVVNRAFLKVLNLDESEAINKTFSISLISTDTTQTDDQDRLESTSVDYEIIGVTPDDITPLIYIPFYHLKALGINNYSQIKIVAKQEEDLRSIRDEIESHGFATASVTDTVNQIGNLFQTAKVVLASIGTIALFIASLGMFNTLTVSLLERMREIGFLKTIGMKSTEIKELFLAESMIMSSLGGFLGLLLGFLSGKLLEAILSIYAISKGVGEIKIVTMPILFVLLVILLSFLVGLLTGIYPAKRSTKVSALNALRYE